MSSHRLRIVTCTLVCVLSLWLLPRGVEPASQAGSLQTPEQFFGFPIGTDNKLARWDRIVEYMRVVAAASPRVHLRDLGKTTSGNPFIALEISSAETMKNLERFKQLERRLYFQGGAPTPAERDEIFKSGKAVVVITCSLHASEIGANQASIELAHRLATDDSPLVRKILDNVIVVLVPSANPDGQILVIDWFNKNLGTEYEPSPIPWLYHPYVGHDNNRDMYMLTQVESQMTAKLLWQDWFPSVWLDEHQMGNNGARIFVMPATDPTNVNVHPLIYRWNGILGQAQAAALEAAGKEGIIYNSTYTNYWEGAMAWAGWWHNEVGLLTEVASVRLASPVEQRKAELGRPPAPVSEDFEAQMRRQLENFKEPLPPPTDVSPRTTYPRPWLGGRWTLRDIVDYDLISAMGLLEATADQREALLRQIYEVNRVTVDMGTKGDPAAIVIPLDTQHDPAGTIRLVDKMRLGGVEVSRAGAGFTADGKTYAAGTFVIPMAQVFARYAKDMLEKQTYPEVRRSPTSPPEPPYDVTAWSLGMQMGVDTVFLKQPVPEAAHLEKLSELPKLPGTVTGNGARFVFDYHGADAATVVNRLLKDGARVALETARAGDSTVTRVSVTGAPRKRMESLANDFGLKVQSVEAKTAPGDRSTTSTALKAPRLGLYQSWTGNMDEGWTRWVLEQYEFAPTVLHNADIKAGKLREKFDAIILPDQQPGSILRGNDSTVVRAEYRGGLGDEGVLALKAFVAGGGTLITLGAACDLVIDRFPVPVRDLKRGLNRDQHFAPGSILRIQVDPTHPIGYGMPESTYGFYNNSPFFLLVEGFSSQRVSVVARYPNTDVVASGWLKGEELMAGHAAVVAIDTNPGRIVLFGLRPQHRAQTNATFPLLFNAIFLAGAEPRAGY